MFSLKHTVAKNLWILMFICCSFSSVSFGAKVFWNECVDMGGVDIDISSGKCMCVNGSLFEPRKKPSEFICDGVGTKLYHIMLGQGQDHDREGSKGVDVVKKYKTTSKLEYQCSNFLNAECYNPEKKACVCKNNYHIDMTNFWPNTRDCYGTRFVSFGLGSIDQNFNASNTSDNMVSKTKSIINLSERFSKMQWSTLPNEGVPYGRFDGILEVKNSSKCSFASGSDTDGLRCSTMNIDGQQYISIDFSDTFEVNNPPSCIAQIIGASGSSRVVDITNEKLLLSYQPPKNSSVANNAYPAGCIKKSQLKQKQNFTRTNNSIVKFSVQCAFVD